MTHVLLRILHVKQSLVNIQDTEHAEAASVASGIAGAHLPVNRPDRAISRRGIADGSNIHLGQDVGEGAVGGDYEFILVRAADRVRGWGGSLASGRRVISRSAQDRHSGRSGVDDEATGRPCTGGAVDVQSTCAPVFGAISQRGGV
jgi:hypothetical protein